MKTLFTLLFASIAFSSFAQTTIYSETFNSGSAPGWTLNTSDEGGVAPVNNQWIINNAYAPGPLGTPTANQPSGIVGYPNSYYLHIYGGPTYAPVYGLNANYAAAMTGDTYFAAMTSPISTMGYTGVTLSFWWLGMGSSTAVGKVFYRTSASGAWTQITAPTATYYNNTSWLQQTIVMSVFDNQAFLEFGFQFTDGTSGGTDPSFAVDDIMVTGSSAAVPPTASYTMMPNDTVCADSCITFTNTSTGGTMDSLKWAISPAVTMTSTTVTPLVQCFPATGAYTVTLTAYGAGSSTNSVQNIYIKPKPSPVITKAGHTLTVPAGYTTYQWYNGATPIAGATNDTYTYTGSGNYSVVVDSGSCKGMSTNNINTAGIPQVSSAENVFWASGENGGLTLWSRELLKETLTVNIYDATGRCVMQGQWPEGSDIMMVGNLSLARGLYIIRLNDNSGGAISLKFIE
jgi:hypothetical protein